MLQNFTLSPVFDAVTVDYQAIFFDRPGLGYSEKPAGEAATPAVQARLLHGALQKLGADRPILVGQSWGGVIALAYALDYPDDLAGIVLLGSSPYPRERHEDFFDVIARMPVVGDLTLNTVYVPDSEVVVADANHYLWYAHPDVVVTAVTDAWVWADEIALNNVD